MARPSSMRLASFRSDDRGAVLVEFAILLPILVVLFATIIEGGRLMWAYQTTAAGVRDAARYLARVAPADICTTGASLAGYTSKLESMVRTASDGANLFAPGITVTAVAPSYTCETPPPSATYTYRVNPTPVAQVTASLTVTFPFASAFELIGSSLATINTTITDQSKVYGS